MNGTNWLHQYFYHCCCFISEHRDIRSNVNLKFQNKQLMILPRKWLITSSGNPPGPAGTRKKVWYRKGAGVPSTTTHAWLMSHLSQEKLKQLSVCCSSTSPWSLLPDSVLYLGFSGLLLTSSVQTSHRHPNYL